MTMDWRALSKQALAEAICNGTFNPKGRDLSGIDLSDVTLMPDDDSEVGGIDFSGCDLTGANFSGTQFNILLLRDAKLDGANFDRASLCQTNFCRATGRAISFRGATLETVWANDAGFPEADFDQAKLVDCRFWGANLAYSKFTNLDRNCGRNGFRYASLDSADLSQGGAQRLIWGANLTGISDDGVRLDDGIKSAWVAAKAECEQETAADKEEQRRKWPDIQELNRRVLPISGGLWTERGQENIEDVIFDNLDADTQAVVREVLGEDAPVFRR
jgi:uncharacterized protein YjbI with pentapeptide repeats